MSSTTNNACRTDADFAHAWLAAPEGIRQVVRNADETHQRTLATAGRLLQDPKTCRVGRRLAQEADADWQRVYSHMCAMDWDWLAGSKRTR